MTNQVQPKETLPVNAAPAVAPEKESGKMGEHKILPFRLHYETSTSLFTKPGSSDNMFVSALQRTAYFCLGIFAFAAESVRNLAAFSVNVVTLPFRFAASVYEASKNEKPEAPETPAPKKAEQPVAPAAPAPAAPAPAAQAPAAQVVEPAVRQLIADLPAPQGNIRRLWNATCSKAGAVFNFAIANPAKAVAAHPGATAKCVAGLVAAGLAYQFGGSAVSAVGSGIGRAASTVGSGLCNYVIPGFAASALGCSNLSYGS